MTLDEEARAGARIKVVGVGGGGSNAVNRMVTAGLDGVEFIVANTDLQALKLNAAPHKLQIGSKLTKGLGAGADPNVGRQAALEDTEKLIEALDGADMVFVTTGLGGGTGTGAAPVIASLASELGALTIAVVTKPFRFEGKKRQMQAERGLEELRECVDTVITIPNERLLATIGRTTSLNDAFTNADDVLQAGDTGDLGPDPGARDDQSRLRRRQDDHAGHGPGDHGHGHGGRREPRDGRRQRRHLQSAARRRVGARAPRGVIINVTGGPDLSLIEVSEASAIIQEAAHEEANIIFGAVVDPKMEGRVKITVIATGFDRPACRAECRGVGGADAGRSAVVRRVEAGVGRARRRQRRVAPDGVAPVGPRHPATGCRQRTTWAPGRGVRAGLAARRARIPPPAERELIRSRFRLRTAAPPWLSALPGQRRGPPLPSAGSAW